jgi:hypothetical protein
MKDLQTRHEAAKAELQAEFAKRTKDLESRESAFAAKQSEYEDRDSKHVRRQIRQDLKNEIAKRNERFSLSESTLRKRFPVHLVYWSLIVLLLAVLIYNLTWGSQHDPVNQHWWVNAVRLPLLSAALAAALVYYLRWNDGWFRKHADEEFRTKQFELDVDRASWLVEMAMEWKDEKGSEIPAELLDRLSANLFNKGAETEAARHPTEDLASALLGASSELSVNIPPIGTAKLNRKGTQRFTKELDKG